MKYLSFLLFVIFFTSSCSILKNKTTGKKNSKTEVFKKKHSVRYEYIKIPSDSVLYVSKLNEKDTIINRNSLNSFLSAKFVKGRIKKIKCSTKPSVKISKTITDENTLKKEVKEEKSTNIISSLKQDHFSQILFVLFGVIILLIVIIIKR